MATCPFLMDIVYMVLTPYGEARQSGIWVFGIPLTDCYLDAFTKKNIYSKSSLAFFDRQEYNREKSGTDEAGAFKSR